MISESALWFVSFLLVIMFSCLFHYMQNIVLIYIKEA